MKEIVIKIHDIPQNDHERWALKNGTPLPKGHGKIGDIDAIILEFSKSKAMTIAEKMKASNILWYAWKNMCLVEADMEDDE